MLQWDSLDQWRFLVQSGQLEIKPGTRLSAEQLAILNHTPATGTFATGAPGSFASRDAARFTRQVQAAATTQRTQELAATARHADPVASIAATIEAQMQRSGILARVADMEQCAMLNAARTDTVQAMRATLEAQEDVGIGKRLSKAVMDTFTRAELTPVTPRRSTKKSDLAELSDRVQALITMLRQHLSRTGSGSVTGARRTFASA